MCGKKGTLLQFVPAQFTLESGEQALTSYRFNQHIASITSSSNT